MPRQAMADAHEKQNAMIEQLAAESERVKTSSGEFLWICKGAIPPKIPDLPQPKGETIPLRTARLANPESINEH
jgi:hypothetical protein